MPEKRWGKEKMSTGKRIATLVLLAALALLTAACGGKDSRTVLSAWQQTQAEEPEIEDDGQKVVLRLTHSSGEESAANKAAVVMRTRLEALSGGTMTIEIFAEDTLGSLNDAWNTFGNGAVDIRIGTAGISQNGVLMWLPLFTGITREQLTQAVQPGAALRKQMEQWSQEKNCELLAVMPIQYRLLAGNVPVQTVSEMKQLIMRTIGSGNDDVYWNALCGSTVNVDVQRLALALQQKLVNACDNTLTNLVEYQTCKQIRYITNLQDRVYFDAIYISRRCMQSLTDTQQGWVQDAAAYAEKEIAAGQTALEQDAAECIEEQGITVYDLKAGEQEKMRGLTRELVLQQCTEQIGQEDMQLLLQYAQQAMEAE